MENWKISCSTIAQKDGEKKEKTPRQHKYKRYSRRVYEHIETEAWKNRSNIRPNKKDENVESGTGTEKTN